jgi:cell division protein FtsI/penicillin-binding protein 2
LRDFLEGVVLEGTGSRAALPDVRVGGKTGTTRRYDPERNATSTVPTSPPSSAFAPVENPQLVCLVMLDDPKAEGSK